jgi:hypothetical protein
VPEPVVVPDAFFPVPVAPEFGLSVAVFPEPVLSAPVLVPVVPLLLESLGDAVEAPPELPLPVPPSVELSVPLLLPVLPVLDPLPVDPLPVEPVPP